MFHITKSFLKWAVTSLRKWLRRLPLDKKAAILLDDIFKYTFENKICILINNIKLNNIPALVQIMALRRIGAKALTEPMMPQFSDAYERHQGDMS